MACMKIVNLLFALASVSYAAAPEEKLKFEGVAIGDVSLPAAGGAGTKFSGPMLVGFSDAQTKEIPNRARGDIVWAGKKFSSSLFGMNHVNRSLTMALTPPPEKEEFISLFATNEFIFAELQQVFGLAFITEIFPKMYSCSSDSLGKIQKKDTSENLRDVPFSVDGIIALLKTNLWDLVFGPEKPVKDRVFDYDKLPNEQKYKLYHCVLLNSWALKFARQYIDYVREDFMPIDPKTLSLARIQKIGFIFEATRVAFEEALTRLCETYLGCSMGDEKFYLDKTVEAHTVLVLNSIGNFPEMLTLLKAPTISEESKLVLLEKLQIMSQLFLKMGSFRISMAKAYDLFLKALMTKEMHAGITFRQSELLKLHAEEKRVQEKRDEKLRRQLEESRVVTKAKMLPAVKAKSVGKTSPRKDGDTPVVGAPEPVAVLSTTTSAIKIIAPAVIAAGGAGHVETVDEDGWETAGRSGRVASRAASAKTVTESLPGVRPRMKLTVRPPACVGGMSAAKTAAASLPIKKELKDATKPLSAVASAPKLRPEAPVFIPTSTSSAVAGGAGTEMPYAMEAVEILRPEAIPSSVILEDGVQYSVCPAKDGDVDTTMFQHIGSAPYMDASGVIYGCVYGEYLTPVPRCGWWNPRDGWTWVPEYGFQWSCETGWYWRPLGNM